MKIIPIISTQVDWKAWNEAVPESVRPTALMNTMGIERKSHDAVTSVCPEAGHLLHFSYLLICDDRETDFLLNIAITGLRVYKYAHKEMLTYRIISGDKNQWLFALLELSRIDAHSESEFVTLVLSQLTPIVSPKFWANCVKESHGKYLSLRAN